MASSDPENGIAFTLARWLFLAFVVCVPLVRPFNTQVGGLRVPLSDIVFLAAFLLWLIALLARKTTLQYHRLYFFTGLYGAAHAVSTAFSINHSTSAVKLAGIFYLIAIAVMTVNLAQEPGFRKKLVYAWLAGTALIVLGSMAGVFIFYAGYDSTATNFFMSQLGSLPDGNYPRMRSLFENVNMMTNYLNVSMILVLAAGRSGWINRRLAYVLAVGIFVAVFFGFSGGIGGIFLSLGLWFGYVFATRSQPLSRGALISGAILAGLALVPILISPDTANTDQDFTLPGTEIKLESSARVLIWQDTIKRGLENPVFGKGTGTDPANITYHALSGQTHILQDAHNAWLNVFGQTGLFGLMAFILLCWYVFSICRFDTSDPLTVAASCAFVGSFLYQNLFGSFEDARHLWILIGLIAALVAGDIDEPS